MEPVYVSTFDPIECSRVKWITEDTGRFYILATPHRAKADAEEQISKWLEGYGKIIEISFLHWSATNKHIYYEIQVTVNWLRKRLWHNESKMDWYTITSKKEVAQEIIKKYGMFLYEPKLYSTTLLVQNITKNKLCQMSIPLPTKMIDVFKLIIDDSVS
jgi:hypothetical protein